ncbi:hypothetical protein DFH27DRAFT_575593 [Peziza echinospora]|nr:hypothetical protein DFH27DRAFT_575593 [Peziza echinospora]
MNNFPFRRKSLTNRSIPFIFFPLFLLFILFEHCRARDQWGGMRWDGAQEKKKRRRRENDRRGGGARIRLHFLPTSQGRREGFLHNPYCDQGTRPCLFN